MRSQRVSSGMEAIDHSYTVFEENKDRLLEECRGKYVVIVGDIIQDERYDSFQEALAEAFKTNNLGTFVVQRVDDCRVDFSSV